MRRNTCVTDTSDTANNAIAYWYQLRLFDSRWQVSDGKTISHTRWSLSNSWHGLLAFGHCKFITSIRSYDAFWQLVAWYASFEFDLEDHCPAARLFPDLDRTLVSWRCKWGILILRLYGIKCLSFGGRYPYWRQ